MRTKRAFEVKIIMKNAFLFHLKSSFCSRDIQIFVFPTSPQFSTLSHWVRGWFNINLEVYDVIICLNKNLITFVWYHEKEKTYDIETLSIDRNYEEIMDWNLVQDPFLILVNNSKQPFHARNCFKNKIFWIYLKFHVKQSSGKWCYNMKIFF